MVSFQGPCYRMVAVYASADADYALPSKNAIKNTKLKAPALGELEWKDHHTCGTASGDDTER